MMAARRSLLALAALAVLLLPLVVDACTCFIVTKGASADGTNLVTYAADSHTLYGYLQHWPRATHPPGTMRDIYDWDSKEYLGQIPEANETYNVIGNVNEYGVAITESTWEGIPELSVRQENATLDYGSLIYIALQRSRTAREALGVMTTLVAAHGWASEGGESMTIADPEEVWVWEVIGKGNYELGAVWVAARIPDGYVSGHANQARIRHLDEVEDMVYSPDVISFARKIGRFPQEAPDAAFSFSDVYNPVTFETARGCDGRVWDFFVRAAPDQGIDAAYLDYVTGANLTNRMPLYIKPSAPLALEAVAGAMRSHYEGTPLQFDLDVGAEAHGLPYRWRPLTWQSSDGGTYFHERAAGTQQTGFNLMAQLRGDPVPDPLKAVLFFGVDDTASSVLTPFYGGVRAVPPAYGEGDIMSFDFGKAFWVFNLVSNYAYSRYSLIHPEIAEAQAELEAAHVELVRTTDAAFMELWAAGKEDEARALADDVCTSNAEAVVKSWLGLFQRLFVKYMDGNVKTIDRGDQAQLLPTVQQPGYSLAWRDRIVAETGDRFRVPASGPAQPEEADAEADEMQRDVAALERGRARPSRRRRRRSWKGM